MGELTFECPSCKTSIEAEDGYCGSEIDCPVCGKRFPAPELKLEPGKEIDGFKLVRRLGAGGMGEVWLAKQESLNRYIALKVLSQKIARDEDFISRFHQEVKMVGMLSHPNIITAYRAGFCKGVHYLALEYVDGAELSNRLKIDKALSERNALLLTRKLAEALSYAWTKFKALHRDIKPENIMISSEGDPKLMDLGISKSLTEDNSLTMTGVVMGTPYYMSPEQARADRQLDCRTDIYSLGATLFHAVTGQVPYNGTTAFSVLSQHLSGDPPPTPSSINKAVSPQCSALIKMMMAKNVEQRPADWEAVIRDIDRVLDGNYPESVKASQNSSSKVQPEVAPQPGSRWKIPAAVAWPARIIFYGAIAWMAYMLWVRNPQEAQQPVEIAHLQTKTQETANASSAQVGQAPGKTSIEELPPVQRQPKPEPAAVSSPPPPQPSAQDAKAIPPQAPPAQEPPEEEQEPEAPAARANSKPGPSQLDEDKSRQKLFQRLHPPQKLGNITSMAMKSLIEGNPQRAEDILKRAIDEGEFEPFNDHIAGMKRICHDIKAADLALLERYKACAAEKRIIKIKTPSGHEIKYKVLDVDIDAMTIQAEELGSGVESSLRPIDINVEERTPLAARPGSKRAMEGIDCLRHGDREGARQAFAEAGELSRPLNMLLTMREAKRPLKPYRDEMQPAPDAQPEGLKPPGSVKSLFKGAVSSFNPETLDIELRYDFHYAIQTDDWKSFLGDVKVQINSGKLLLSTERNAMSLYEHKARFDDLTASANCVYKGSNGFCFGVSQPERDDGIYFIVAGFGNSRDGIAKGPVSKATPLGASATKASTPLNVVLTWEGGRASFKTNWLSKWGEQPFESAKGAALRLGVQRGSTLECSEIIVAGRLNRAWFEAATANAPMPPQKR